MKNIIIYIFVIVITMGNCRSQNPIAGYPSEDIVASIPYLGEYARGRVTIDFINGNTDFTRPLIVVEGFDLSSVIDPEAGVYGEINYTNFRTSIQTANSNNLRDMIWDNNRKDFDIIYLDFANGVDYMQRNAYLVQEVIKWVNTEKAANGITEPNVVLGQSMGGVVARYALADMEERGEVHDTRLFISHDAPQQGANIPIGLQYMYRHGLHLYASSGVGFLAGEYVVPLFTDGVGVSDYLSLLGTPASRQLLINRVTPLTLSINNTAHDIFYNELKNKGLPGSGGYPTLCKNIALSNGSECGARQNFEAGDDLVNIKGHTGRQSWIYAANVLYSILGGPGAADPFLSVLPGHSRYDVEMNVKSISYIQNNEIYHGDIFFTKDLFNFIKIKEYTSRMSVKQPNGILPFDNYGGGGFYNMPDEDIIKANLPDFIETDELFFRDFFNFIPTTSALDIGQNNIALLDGDYLSPYIGAQPPLAPRNTPFDNFSTEFDRANPMNTHNQEHISFNRRNGDWLAAELDGNNVTFTDCSGYCTNAEIVGSDNLCLNTSETYSLLGTTDIITWTVIDPVTGLPSSLVTLSPNGNSVTLTPTNTGGGLITLIASITTPDPVCGGGVFTKDIWIGAPAIEVELESNINYVTAYLVGENGTDIESQGITSVVWEELANDGECYGNFHANNFIGQGNGNCINWRVDVKITVTNDCGTTVIYSTITPRASDPCNDGLRMSQNPMKQGASTNKIIIDPCSNTNGKETQRQDYTLSIHTQYGEQVYYKSQKATEFNISHLKKGFYIARLRTRQGTIVSEKFIIEE